MGYYCTVPQCTSLAGKTKNVKFHRFPRDVTMADKWNIILKRGKPYTKYSKVCSLHFTHADYNVTTMGQWKTLSKDAVPSQNLPKLNPDGTVMVIRKSRTVKYKENRREDDETRHQARFNGEKVEKWHLMNQLEPNKSSETQEANLAYRLQSLTALANNISPQDNAETTISVSKPKKQDAIMQTDPVQSEEDDTQPNNSYSETSDKSFNSELQDYPVAYQKEDYSKTNNFEMPKDYTKPTDDYIPQTNEEYNKEAEKYALERKSHNGYDKIESSFANKVNYQSGIGSEKFPKVGDYQKDFKVSDDYQKLPVENGYQGYQFSDKDYQRDFYQPSSFDTADILRNQQHNLHMLQQPRSSDQSQGYFTDSQGIKQEVDLSTEDDKFLYERKEALDTNFTRSRNDQQRLEQLQHQLKQEPETNGHDTTLQVQQSTYYPGSGHETLPGGYYSGLSRPGPELLIAKQNALAAHTQLWQNSMKRPFFYSDSAHYNTPQLLHRYEDLQRILQ